MPLNAEKALDLAIQAYSASTTYFDSSIRRDQEAALRQFRSEHPVGSKYRSDAYATRSKLFRPKTRAMVTRAEALVAEAFFSTADAVTILAEDEDNKEQLVSAEVNKALLNYRLGGRDPKRCIPWFLTVVGALQEAYVNGVVVSRQDWEFDKVRGIDRPSVNLLPVENFRFDPNASWVDPVNSSPYTIELTPMYVKDVMARVERGTWNSVTDQMLLTATQQAKFDSTRQTREGSQRTDPRQSSTAINEYTIVWVHRNIVEWNGVDYVYYTLGTESMLSQVRVLRDEVWHGRRNYVMGYAALEAHRNYPTAPVLQVKDLQAASNDVGNLRIDNVKFILSKRYFVRRNAQVDLRSLTRNSVGSATLMKDPEKDVKVVDYNDVTGSSYQEQDRLNVEFDELSGMFSGSSVQSNRKLNETVGGMNLLAADTNQVGSYRLRTFVETWAEPVLSQLVDLEQKYESDDVVMALAGAKSPLYQRYGQNMAINSFLEQRLNVSVNVGFGPTNPTFQLERFMNAMRQFKEILADAVLRDAGIDIEEVKKEIFGKLGYRDGRRFFVETDNPELASLQQQVQALQAQLAAKESPEERQAKVEKLAAETRKITAEAQKLEQELAALAQGGNPEAEGLRQQLTQFQQDASAREQEWTRERDQLELRLADRSDEVNAKAGADVEKHRSDNEAKVRIAELDAKRSKELGALAEGLKKIERSLEELAGKVEKQRTEATTSPSPAGSAEESGGKRETHLHVHVPRAPSRTMEFREGPDGSLTGKVRDDDEETES
jgi:hypothetical protein